MVERERERRDEQGGERVLVLFAAAQLLEDDDDGGVLSVSCFHVGDYAASDSIYSLLSSPDGAVIHAALATDPTNTYVNYAACDNVLSDSILHIRPIRL